MYIYVTKKGIVVNFSTIGEILHCYTPKINIYISPVHYPTRDLAAKKAKSVKAGSQYLHYHMNNLNAEKNPNPVVT